MPHRWLARALRQFVDKSEHISKGYRKHFFAQTTAHRSRRRPEGSRFQTCRTSSWQWTRTTRPQNCRCCGYVALFSRIHTCVTYVDDRTIGSPSLDHCLAAARLWRDWSDALGLRENLEKEQYFHQTEHGRASFIAQGVDPTQVVDSPKILGSCFAGTTGRGLVPSEQKRLDLATKTAKKCSLLPCMPEHKLRYVAAAALPCATYGWKQKRPGQDAILPLQDEASPHLCRLLRGHGVDFDFKIASDGLAWAFRRRMRGKRPPCWTRPSRRRVLLCDFAKTLGWHCTAPWTWHHQGLNKTFCLIPSRRCDYGSLDGFKHDLREGWRRDLFRQWLGSGRVDASYCQHVPYSETRCKAARQMAFRSAHHMAVLSGAFISPMRVRQIRHRPGARSPMADDFGMCPQCNVANDFLHWSWHCSMNSNQLNFDIPIDQMQLRLGWPLRPSSPACVQVLEHLASRRADAIMWRLGHP